MDSSIPSDSKDQNTLERAAKSPPAGGPPMTRNFQPPPANDSPFLLIKWSFLQAHQHITGLACYLFLPIALVIGAFIPFLIHFINLVGAQHIIVSITAMIIAASVNITIIFMSAIYLFNKTHPPSQALKIGTFTKEITWPWFWESSKALCIIILGLIAFIIPGIIKIVHYMFLNHIVFFNQKYKADQLDALKHSRELGKGMAWWLFGLYYLLPILMSFLCNAIFKNIRFKQAGKYWRVSINAGNRMGDNFSNFLLYLVLFVFCVLCQGPRRLTYDENKRSTKNCSHSRRFGSGKRY